MSDDDSLSGGESFVEGFYSNDSTVSDSDTVDTVQGIILDRISSYHYQQRDYDLVTGISTI